MLILCLHGVTLIACLQTTNMTVRLKGYISDKDSNKAFIALLLIRNFFHTSIIPLFNRVQGPALFVLFLFYVHFTRVSLSLSVFMFWSSVNNCKCYQSTLSMFTGRVYKNHYLMI